jgi:hypothetical protein
MPKKKPVLLKTTKDSGNKCTSRFRQQMYK